LPKGEEKAKKTMIIYQKCVFLQKKNLKVRLTIRQFNAKLCLFKMLWAVCGETCWVRFLGGVSYPVRLLQRQKTNQQILI